MGGQLNLPCRAVTTTTAILRPFFWDHPGEPVPEETSGLYGARED